MKVILNFKRQAGFPIGAGEMPKQGA